VTDATNSRRTTESRSLDLLTGGFAVDATRVPPPRRDCTSPADSSSR